MKEVDHARQVDVVDRMGRLSPHDRLRVIGDADAALRHELEIVRAIADTDDAVAIDSEPISYFDQRVAFAVCIDDVADELPGEFAIRDFEAVRTREIELQPLLQPIRDVGEAAGNE